VIIGTPAQEVGYQPDQYGHCQGHTSSGIYFFSVDETLAPNAFVEASESTE
jgi:hypothetical protein